MHLESETFRRKIERFIHYALYYERVAKITYIIFKEFKSELAKTAAKKANQRHIFIINYFLEMFFLFNSQATVEIIIPGYGDFVSFHFDLFRENISHKHNKNTVYFFLNMNGYHSSLINDTDITRDYCKQCPPSIRTINCLNIFP